MLRSYSKASSDSFWNTTPFLLPDFFIQIINNFHQTMHRIVNNAFISYIMCVACGRKHEWRKYAFEKIVFPQLQEHLEDNKSVLRLTQRYHGNCEMHVSEVPGHFSRKDEKNFSQKFQENMRQLWLRQWNYGLIHIY